MPVPTDQQILDALRTAFHEIAVGGAASYTVNGRTWTGQNLTELQKLITVYEARVNASTRRTFAVGQFRGAS